MNIEDVAKMSKITLVFDYTNPNWEVNPEYSAAFIRMSLTYMNDKLHARGHLFLNEVLDHLGMARTPEGALLGWMSVAADPAGLVYRVIREETRFVIELFPDDLIWDKI